MAGFTSYDDLINQSTVNGQQLTWDFFKIGPTLQGAGSWGSLWTAAGSPGAGADPALDGSSAVWDSVAGSMNWADDGAHNKVMVSFGAVGTQNCTLQLVDRLVGVLGATSALTSTGNKQMRTAALDRYTTTAAAVVEAWLEITAATTTGSTCAVQLANSGGGTNPGYTNEGGTSGRQGTVLTFPAAVTVLRYMAKLPLAAGDKGVRSAENLWVSVAATTTGTAAIILQRPICTIPIVANLWNERDTVLQYAALPRIYDKASLAIQQLGTAATATTFWGTVRLAYN